MKTSFTCANVFNFPVCKNLISCWFQNKLSISNGIKSKVCFFHETLQLLLLKQKKKIWSTLIIESYGMSLECHDTWCHLLTSFLVEKDVKILWKCHDILMEFNRIFMRKRHPRQMPWECHEIPMSFNGIQSFGSFWWHFYGESLWNCHGVWRHFRPKLGWVLMVAFYY